MATGPITQPDSSQPIALDQAATRVAAHDKGGATTLTLITEN